MASETIITLFYAANTEDSQVDQYYDAPFVPRIGERVQCFSNRDGDGNYRTDRPLDALGAPRPDLQFEGIVTDVSYVFEQSGTERTYRKAIFAQVFIRPFTAEEKHKADEQERGA